MVRLLRPAPLSNCRLERFGEANDGGYLMCGNQPNRVQSAYSYRISGSDQWGCDVERYDQQPSRPQVRLRRKPSAHHL
jgi:hypothetical protein